MPPRDHPGSSGILAIMDEAAPPTAVSGLAVAASNAALLAWHDAHGKRFRIRASRDPWAILVAETMSQQTQMSRVDEHWEAFVARFPDAASLAAADTPALLRAWAGLGYNRRAVALREAARELVRRHAGRVPSSVDALEALPGVGPYTARAVAARAHGVAVAAIDVNVRRVLARTWGEWPPSRKAQQRADAAVDADRPGAWNDAVMDLASFACTRRTPLCESCPISAWCASAGTPGDDSSPARRGDPVPFPATRRWLRGRLVAELRDLPSGTWRQVEDGRGVHGPVAVDEALSALEHDGLVERDPVRGARLR
jgi:A/G-specific adenine glycosylase